MLMKNNPAHSINGSEFKVKVITRESFVIYGCDATAYTPYEGNGIAKQIKVPLKMNF